MNRLNHLIVICFLLLTLAGFTQVNTTVVKSEEIQSIGGKDYYIHTIIQGNTVYSLSKVYEVSMSEIEFENPNAKLGLNLGDRIKIPLNSRDTQVKSDLSSSDFEFFYHIAKKYQKLEDISRIYQVDLDMLRAANRGIGNTLILGQYIKVPVALKSRPNQQSQVQIPVPKVNKDRPVQKEENVIHVVIAGDNLYRLAIRYRRSIVELQRANPGLTINLFIGQKIIIPKKKIATNFITHEVKRKEKLNRIARNYDMSVDDIREINPFVRNKPYRGQVLKIPLEPEIIEEPVIEELAEEEIVEVPENRDYYGCLDKFYNKEKTYNVALMLPLFLEEVDSILVDEFFNPDQLERYQRQAFRFLPFYYGILTAIDSLEQAGLKIQLHVYDVDNDVSKALAVTTENRNLRDMDLIIGPFYPASFSQVASFAKSYRIPIINPLTTRDELIKNNPFAYKIQPDYSQQDEIISALIYNNQLFKNSKIFLINHKWQHLPTVLEESREVFEQFIPDSIGVQNLLLHDIFVEQAIADTSLTSEQIVHHIYFEGNYIDSAYIEDYMFDTSYFENKITSIIYERDSIHGFEDVASVSRNNLVIINTENSAYAKNLLTQLNILRDTFPITVIGVPKWERLDKIDNELLQNLNVHFLSSKYLNYNDYNFRNFIKDYRSKYLCEPNNYAITGFDIGWYFFQALMLFGNDFDDCLPYYKPTLIKSEIEFERANNRDGKINTHWDVLRHRNYQIQKIIVPPITIIEEE